MTAEYIAGFFDGEGTISIMGNKVRCLISQTNEEILLQIKDYLGGGSVYKVKKRKEHWKDAWMYSSGGNKQSYKVLTILEPHLILKKELLLRAKELLEVYFKGDQTRLNRNKESIRLVVEEGKSYRQVEEITGISRQVLCTEMKKYKSSHSVAG